MNSAQKKLSLKRWLLTGPLLVTMGLVVGCTLIVQFQEKLIYHPRPYKNLQKSLPELPHSVSVIPFEWEGQQQYVYSIPKLEEMSELQHVWLMFGGNAGRALDWIGRIPDTLNSRVGYLLVEYPSYGQNEGEPNPESLLGVSLAAHEAFATMHEAMFPVSADADTLTTATREIQYHAMGHSLGAAAMLQFAAKRPLETLYIIAPFTSTKAMARRMFGPLIAPFVYHIYDNMARLEEIHAQETVPRIVMIHGDRDATIPVRMGREIAEKYPETIQYIELQGKQHVDVLDDAELWLEEWTKNR